MTRTQKINKRTLSSLLRTFATLPQPAKIDFLMQFMEEFPEYYADLISNLDKETYNKIIGQA
jgi:hypothetical protein